MLSPRSTTAATLLLTLILPSTILPVTRPTADAVNSSSSKLRPELQCPLPLTVIIAPRGTRSYRRITAPHAITCPASKSRASFAASGPLGPRSSGVPSKGWLTVRPPPSSLPIARAVSVGSIPPQVAHAARHSFHSDTSVISCPHLDRSSDARVPKDLAQHAS